MLYNTAFYEIMVSKDLNKQLEHIKEYASAPRHPLYIYPAPLYIAVVWRLWDVCVPCDRQCVDMPT